MRVLRLRFQSVHVFVSSGWRSGVVVWVSGLQGSRFGAARSFNKKLTEGFGLRVQFRVLGLGVLGFVFGVSGFGLTFHEHV